MRLPAFQNMGNTTGQPSCPVAFIARGYRGSGSWLDRRAQRDLSRGEASAARRLELLRAEQLQFVDADHVAAIAVGLIRCGPDAAQATTLPSPAHDAPLYYANTIGQAPDHAAYRNQAMYGILFRRALARGS
jgi:hypothetical protein